MLMFLKLKNYFNFSQAGSNPNKNKVYPPAILFDEFNVSFRNNDPLLLVAGSFSALESWI